MNGTVRLVASVADAFADLVAGDLADHSRTAVPTSPYALFLSGGGTAQECYEVLATRPGLPWGNVAVYLGDERCVPLDDADSNHRMIVETLLDRVGPVAGDHPMYETGEPATAAAAYQTLVSALGRPDLVHLGLGPDGHCASLFPGSTALDDADPDHLVVSTVDPSGRNPHPRLTLTLTAIARARRTVVTVSGAAKHDALAAVVGGVDLPASRLTGDDLLWLVDADALGSLPPDDTA